MAQLPLPPLPAIRCFEAAARLQNFTRAAEELGMTQAAVSYQIKMLEDRVGSSLFLRGLVEGQKIGFDVETDRRSGKDAAANLQQV